MYDYIFFEIFNFNMHKIIVSQGYSCVLLTLSKDILLYLIIKSIIKGKFRNQIKFSHCTRSLTITLIEFLIFVVILLIQTLDTSFDVLFILLHRYFVLWLMYFSQYMYFISCLIYFIFWSSLLFVCFRYGSYREKLFFVSYQSNLNITLLRNIVKYFV